MAASSSSTPSAATCPTATTSRPSSTRTAGRSATRSSRSPCRRTRTTEGLRRFGDTIRNSRLLRDRKQDPEQAAAADFALDLDLPAQQGHDAVADREAQAGADA